jgi:class 3 adenylate cyclase
MTHLRYLTVLFADLVASVSLSELLEPETLRNVQLRYQELALSTIEHYGGFIAQYQGDGVLAYFGYPAAHENDAERAVRAALDLVPQIRALDLRDFPSLQRPLSSRVGIHTGLVAIGLDTMSMGRIAHGAVGATMNIAARIQSEAASDTVVISGATLQLVEGLFESEALGSKPVRGLSYEVPVHHVLRPKPNANRTLSRSRRGAVKMIGRQLALGQLVSAWQTVVRDSTTRTVHIVGEAGIGKSRLVLELCDAVDLPARNVLQANCLELYASTPLYPAAGLLWSRAGISTEDEEPDRRQKVVNLLRSIDIDSVNFFDDAAILLGLSSASPGTTSSLPLETRRRQFSLIIDIITCMVHRMPVLLWIDDAHWLDPSTSELLGQLVQKQLGLPLLIAITQRAFPIGPELPKPDEIIRLGPLTSLESIELARSIPGAQSLTDGALTKISAIANGVPLFVEQLVVSLLNQTNNPSGTATDNKQIPLPLTLAEMLSERLDRLEDGRHIVQVAACLGSSATSLALAELVGCAEEELLERLEALVAADIFRRLVTGDVVEYEFCHALLQRVAYESIAQDARRIIHKQIAHLLRSGSNSGEALPEIVAHHLTEAGDLEPAVQRWLEAGIQASRRSANIEALEHLDRGLGIVNQTPAIPDWEDHEIRLHVARIGPISATFGASSAEMNLCCRRGLKLCLDRGLSPSVFPFLYGQFTFLISRARASEALELANQFLSLAKRSEYPQGQVIGHRLVGMASLALGDAALARAEVERSLQLYVPERDAAGTYVFGQNAQVHGAALLSLALFCLGEVDSAWRIGFEALRTADELRHPHSTAIAFAYVGGWVSGLSGASDLVMQVSRRLINISNHYQLGVFHDIGEAFLGWAMCQQGNLHQGIATVERAVAGLAAADFRLCEAGFLTILADSKRMLGLTSEACALSERAMKEVTGAERWLEPEVLRVAALVRSEATPGDPAAIALLRTAIATARNRATPVLELRCLQSLCTLASGDELHRIESRIDELVAFHAMHRRINQFTFASC